MGILFFTFWIDSERFLFTMSAIMSSCTFPISPSYAFLTPITVAMTPNRMMSCTLAEFPWYSNTVYEEDFSEAIDQRSLLCPTGSDQNRLEPVGF